jgi:hypothetical protein
MDLVDLVSCRWARIDHQDDGEGLLGRLKVCDLLRHSVFEDLEIFFRQSRDESSISIEDRHWSRHEIRLDANDFVSGFGVGFDAGGGGGMLIRSAPAGCDRLSLFMAGADRERFCAGTKETTAKRSKRQTAVFIIGGSSRTTR